MNFYCSKVDRFSPPNGFDKNRVGDWYIYLDKGWSRHSDGFYKGTNASWCKIKCADDFRIETNMLRDFPLHHDDQSVSNFHILREHVPVDGVVSYKHGRMSTHYIESFYPDLDTERLSFNQCQALLYECLVENIQKFLTDNKRPLLLPATNHGIDTLTVRSVLDHMGIEYGTFELREILPGRSKLWDGLRARHWGFSQVEDRPNNVIATGFYGDEWILRNPYYVHLLLSTRGINLREEFDKKSHCYMKAYFEGYRKKCSRREEVSLEKLSSMICNDFQIWHVDDTYFFSPLKHPRLTRLLNADNETIIGQVTDARLSRSIIEKCNPVLLDLLDKSKNSKDPKWFKN